MSQSVKYQGTSVDAGKSVMELQEIIQKYGATRFELRYSEGRIVGIRFALAHPTLGELPVRLPARINEVEAKLLEAEPWNHRRRRSRSEHNAYLREQAYRVAWRHLKDFVEQILVAVDLGMVEAHEAFLWAVEVEGHEGSETVGDLVARSARLGPGGALQLTSGGS